MGRDVAREALQSDPGSADSGLDAFRASGAVQTSLLAPDRHESNEHIALLYETQAEQLAAAVPFVRQGLERGEKCLYVVDDNSEADLIAAMRDAGIDVEAARESGDLTFLTADAYVESGAFEPDDQLAFLADAIADAAEKFPGVRVAVEMTCFLDDDLEYDDLVAYEERYNSLSENVDATALCQYNRNRFPADVIRDTIRAHPHIIADGTLSHNVYYTPPEEFFGAERPAHEVDRMVSLMGDLAEAETELKHQNERLEEFAGIISHDLRNPLSIAEGQLELARSDPDGKHLDAIERAHGRMRRLIEDILALARHGQRVEEFEPVSIGRFAETCWQTVETANARLRIDTDATIRADAIWLRQLFENLVRNAVEHGGEDVTVTVGDLDDGFYVEDTGRGIPEHERGRVFESGVSSADSGTGFGLAIVRRIAEAHDWSIDVVESDAGGARFEIRGVERVE